MCIQLILCIRVYDPSLDSHHTPLHLQTSRRMQQTRLQHVTWLGNTSSLLMISENDIYLRMGPAMEDIRLTDTGVPGVIYNGVPDWLYQEEVLPKPQATWPSSDGTHILYATFNDTRVSALEFPWFGTQLGQDGTGSSSLGVSKSFPPSRSIRYPRPGSPNPEVELWVMNLGNMSSNYSGIGNITLSAKTKLKPPPSLNGQYVKLFNCRISLSYVNCSIN